MGRINLVSDAEITAISLVDKGANRKQFFLRKAEGARSLPSPQRLVKSEDWSAVYCVVAEPGWAENPGLGAAEPEVDDLWASEEEIRKAAHSAMQNDAFVNAMHEGFEPFGKIVENVVALADFEVNGETIRKGSWYVAIAPTPAGKAAIEKGEFTGVSIEGLARRTPVEKGSTRRDRSVGVVKSPLLQKIAEKVGLTAEEIEAVEKADRTFGEIIAQREFDQVLPDALDAFRDAVWYAFFPHDPDAADPVTLITESCDEFKAWALKQLESVPVEKAERAQALGVTLDGSTPPTPTFGEDTMDTETKDRFEKLETAQADMAAGITKLTEGVAEIAKAVKTEPEAPTVESVAESVTKLSEGLDGIKADIAKLGAGGTTQTEAPASATSTNQNAEAVAKAFQKQGVNPALAGVLG